MPDQSQQTNTTPAAQPASSSNPVPDGDIMSTVAIKITDAHNILIALSSNPTVDELAGAIGLSLFLDRAGKRATAIYSGHTPNALEFLHPADTFESSADALQDFVIALSKDKADHLRYKLDGDYVRIFITPYKSRIAKEDLEFSYGDYNIDLVLALGVKDGEDLDDALREHGRIMHDATIVNITMNDPGKLGEIEWSDTSVSSVCEMLTALLYDMGGKNALEAEEATALLTGIVAATNRFSNALTTPATLQISSRLMQSGADQQLVSENISADLASPIRRSEKPRPSKSTFSVSHAEPKKEEDEKNTEAPEPEEAPKPEIPAPATTAPKEPEAKPEPTPEPATAPSPSSDASDSALLADLQAAAASLTSDTIPSPVTPPTLTPSADLSAATPSLPGANIESGIKPETVLAPTTEFASETAGGVNKYGQMLEAALAEANGELPAPATPAETPTSQPQPVAPIVGTTPNAAVLPPTYTPPLAVSPVAPTIVPANPAASIAPPVASAPEVNGVPEINYTPENNSILPPPPAPPVDINASMLPPTSTPDPITTSPAVVMPEVKPPTALNPLAPTPEAPVIPEPAPVPEPSPAAPTPPASDGSAFKIPGM